MNVGLFIVWLIKSLVGLIDSIIYWVDAELYDLMLDIASAEVFNKQTINTVAERVYQLLALVMLFRLIFAFLSYIINPNDMTDKNKGFGNIIKKIIITLFLIVITPFCFDLSRSLQETIIKDKVIEYFIFGQVKPTNASAGYNMMHTVGKMFVVPYKCQNDECTAENNPNLEKCDGDWSKNLPFTVNLNGGYTSKENGTGKCGYGYTHYWQQLYDASQVDGIDDQKNIFALMQLGSTGKRDKHLIFGIHVIDESLVDYLFLISTGVGIFIGYMLIVMCIDVAIRSVKLSFYEIIAPVPIISYIGPKDGKDTMLSKWFSEVLKTYADLFTRIAGLQLAVFFINEIITSGVVLNGDGVANIIFVNIFLVLGALTFAKNLPKILEGMGIKFSGGEGFNLKKRLATTPGVSTALGAGAGLAGGALANWNASRQSGRGFFRSAASALGGAATGAARGGWAGTKDKDGFGISKGFGAAGKSGQKIMKYSGTRLGERMVAGAQQRLGLDTRADINKKRFDNQDSWQKIRKDLEAHALEEVNKDSSFEAKGVSYLNQATGMMETRDINLASMRARLETAKNSGWSEDDIVTIQNAISAAEKTAKTQWIDSNLSDPEVQNAFTQLNTLEDKLNMSHTVNSASMSTNKGTIESSMGDRYSADTRRAEKTKEATKPSGK